MKHTFWSLVVLLFLTACEGGTDLKKIIVNNTGIPIEVIVYNNYHEGQDTLTISANTETVYYSGGGDRRFFKDYNCLTEIDSILVINADGKVLKKDLMDINNWTKETSGKRNILHLCTLEINLEDFE